MSKQIDKNKSTQIGASNGDGSAKKPVYVPFMAFWLCISDNLGNARLRINDQAKSINNFIDASGDPKDYLFSIIQSSYKRSQCYHLQAPLCVTSVLDILGETAFELENRQQDDLYDIEFLEEIAFVISERYGHCIQFPKLNDSHPAHIKHGQTKHGQTEHGQAKRASVRSLANHKIKLANNRYL